jgi:hypothetical protein
VAAAGPRVDSAPRALEVRHNRAVPRPGGTFALRAAVAAVAAICGGAMVLAATAGCGVRLDDSGGSGGGPDGAMAADAAIDARPCTGGDAAQASPSGACFFLISAPSTFAGAQTACAGQGGHLAIVRSAVDDQTAGGLVGTMGIAFIGLTDQAVEGTFVWGDNAGPAYTNWYMGEPNDGGGQYPEDCAVIAGVRGGQWDDRPCAPVPNVGGGSYSALCQR